ncbi:ParG [Roseimaritima multifibrata]|uniref:ParG n=1 Tax=Roseimaritima multifibrata TaxID=1930274 RepID=A0A517M9Q8_9BACT|nr:plasmid partition protein ParG [Roseimaritima multifibrata]QDS91622.1 ParG [Roseimaritima multifibrata]
MSKRITMSARPKPKPEVDNWVEMRESSIDVKPRTKPKRLTIDIDPELHTELKISCAKRGIQIADLLRNLIEGDVRRHDRG